MSGQSLVDNFKVVVGLHDTCMFYNRKSIQSPLPNKSKSDLTSADETVIKEYN